MIRFLSFLVILLLSSNAYAKDSDKFNDTYNAEPVIVSKSDLSDLKHTKSGRIDKIIDSLTLLLKDGTIVRLSALDIPDYKMWELAPYSDDAMKYIKQKLPERTEVMLYQTRDRKKGRVNRLSHELAHIVIKENNEWIQGDLIANGLSRVYTTPNSDEMLKEMYALEDIARQEKRGLWEEDSYHLIQTPANMEENVKDHIGNFVIIEGTVQKAASVKNTTYLNFGKNWKTDFTIMVTPALRKKFSKKGINVLGLSNTPVRVRGWMREYNGPLIELEDTAHLEVLAPIKKTPLQNDEESLNLPEDSPTKAMRIRGNNNYGSAQE